MVLGKEHVGLSGSNIEKSTSDVGSSSNSKLFCGKARKPVWGDPQVEY